jgi:hypothetical protein
LYCVLSLIALIIRNTKTNKQGLNKMTNSQNEKVITVNGWNGDQVLTLEEYLAIWKAHSNEFARLAYDNEETEAAYTEMQAQAHKLVTASFHSKYARQND